MVISRVISQNGRNYMEHNGLPRLMLGVQIRLDDAVRAGCCEREIEEYFAKAAECNFPAVCIPIEWSIPINWEKSIDWDCDVDSYLPDRDSPYVQRCLAYADKYNLSVHWLWFGSNVLAGQSRVPKDIANNPVTYPQFTYEENGRKETVIDVTTPAFIEREKEALGWFLVQLKKFDKNHRTCVIQIQNEPNYHGFRGQRKERLKAIGILGSFIKESDFSLVTRVNITSPEYLLNEDPLIDELLALDGVDAVGVDVYINRVEFCSDFADRMNMTGTNIAHFAELGPHVDVITRIMGDSLQRSCGMLIYELRTVGKFHEYDFGLYRRHDHEWIKRDGRVPVQYQWTAGEFTAESVTDDVALFNKMMLAAENALATCVPGNTAMINAGSKAKIDLMTVSFDTDATGNNAFGIACYGNDGFMYCFTLVDKAYFKINNCMSVETAGVGAFENGEWNELSTVCLSEDNTLSVTGGLVYRVKVAEIKSV